LVTAREIMKAQRTSQTIGSAYPCSAAIGVIVPVNASTQTAMKTTAPIGAGRTIDPMMVARKMANSRQP
jgi:hypothetical protein